jgi:hypothetical protein
MTMAFRRLKSSLELDQKEVIYDDIININVDSLLGSVVGDLPVEESMGKYVDFDEETEEQTQISDGGWGSESPDDRHDLQLDSDDEPLASTLQIVTSSGDPKTNDEDDLRLLGIADSGGEEEDEEPPKKRAKTTRAPKKKRPMQRANESQEPKRLKTMASADTAIDATQSQEPAPPILRSVQTLINAVQEDKSHDLIKGVAACEINESNTKHIDSSLKSIFEGLKTTNNPHAEEMFKGNKQNLKTFNKLKEMAASGIFDTQSNLAHQLRKDVKKDPSIKKVDSKNGQDWRLKWVSATLEAMKSKYVMEVSWRKIETTKWVYRTFGALVIHLGGWTDPAAIEGATNGVIQSMSMGPPFVKMHPQTKMLNFAIAEMEWAEVFEEAWKETKDMNQLEDGDAEQESPKAGNTKGAEATTNKHVTNKKIKGAVEEKNKRTTKKAEDGQDADLDEKKETPEEKKRKNEQKIMREATKIKERYVRATTQAQFTLEATSKKTQFKWVPKTINKQIEACRKQLSAFDREFMTVKDFGKLKAKHGQPLIIIKLTELVGKLEKPCKDLETTIDKINVARDTLKEVDTDDEHEDAE